MATLKEATGSFRALEPSSYFLEILSQATTGAWELNLPPRLKSYQSEIETLLAKVFAGRPRSQENLELAQQMTLNWCLSKCRKIGIKLEECWLPES